MKRRVFSLDFITSLRHNKYNKMALIFRTELLKETWYEKLNDVIELEVLYDFCLHYVCFKYFLKKSKNLIISTFNSSVTNITDQYSEIYVIIPFSTTRYPGRGIQTF